MSWRLWKIGVYSRKTGELREIEFNLFGLSVITGRSSRGKSSILDIVNYCLLSSGCPIAKGVIRDHASHVGAVFAKGDEHFVVVRPLPKEGRLTSYDVHIATGYKLDLPATPPEELRWNIEAAREQLSEFTGIEALPVLANERDADPESRTPANIRHCAFYLFQPQDVIASRNMAFAGLEDAFKKRHASDASYYFLGILTIERLRRRRELRALNSERNSLERRLREKARLRADGFEHGLRLWGEAAALGMANNSERPPTMSELMGRLGEISHYKIDSIVKATDELNLGDVQNKEAEVRRLLRQKNVELAAIDRFTREAEENAAITDKQIARLELRDLLPDPDKNNCPVCGSESVDVSSMERMLSEGLRSLASVRNPPKRISGKLEQEGQRLKEEIAELKETQVKLQAQLKVLFSDLQRSRTLLEDVGRRQQIIGRAKEVLNAMRRMETPLDERGAELSARIDELEAEVGDNAIRRLKKNVDERLSDLINQILSLGVEVEFPDASVRINFVDFVFEIQLDGQWVGLNELGSGANWLSYHVAGAVALHKLFLKLQSPVPSVLMLDQPSQAWFPAETAKLLGRAQPTGDRELTAVRSIYQLLFEESQGEKSPQIIVVDHARLNDEWFSVSVVQDWHDGDALIPDSWIGA
ncbi:hypothetical protein CYFUS_005998 [Cystobacter fuscus]|uniref:DUF3732 domain-containing protein n=1 Tax=Cystobacter fuscus TaxID=43 RepID=A0A250J9E8_9BACT|nr:DUF3732 domain-containing protein [Cystobacter fuscus]ATB40549.1 hypothetical protein CYFUS_005998 [Cystobacter fuscus]